MLEETEMRLKRTALTLMTQMPETLEEQYTVLGYMRELADNFLAPSPVKEGAILYFARDTAKYMAVIGFALWTACLTVPDTLWNTLGLL